MSFAGTGVALVTPFDNQGRVDVAALRRLVQHVTTGGVDYLVPMGTTGESATLTDDEYNLVVHTVIDENKGRLPILLGCGGNDTAAVARKMEKCQKQFAVQGFLSVSPYYNRPAQAGIVAHYQVLAAASSLPIILYNVPPRTGSNVLPDTVVQIAHACPRVVGIKEASGSLEQGMRILRDAPKGFLVISGDDPLALPGIACGFAGVISVVANAIPRQFSQLIKSALVGDWAQARAAQLAQLRFMELLFAEGNPAGVKAALAAAGVCCPALRLPLVQASDKLSQLLAQELKAL